MNSETSDSSNSSNNTLSTVLIVIVSFFVGYFLWNGIFGHSSESSSHGFSYTNIDRQGNGWSERIRTVNCRDCGSLDTTGNNGCGRGRQADSGCTHMNNVLLLDR